MLNGGTGAEISTEGYSHNWDKRAKVPHQTVFCLTNPKVNGVSKECEGGIKMSQIAIKFFYAKLGFIILGY